MFSLNTKGTGCFEFEKSNVERVITSNKYLDRIVKGRENPVDAVEENLTEKWVFSPLKRRKDLKEICLSLKGSNRYKMELQH